MIFTSYEFLIFLVIVFSAYWLLRRKYQNILLVIASYVFYGWWDWRFLFLLLTSTIIDFAAGLLISSTENEKKRRLFLALSLGANIGILGFFKYFNFFIASLRDLLAAFGASDVSLTTLSIILPIGISFYTFQSMSYAIDIYRRKLAPTKDFIQFTAFVSFFPQLVAGPIERATHLLPQFARDRHFEPHAAFDALKRIFWGFFKKIILADNFGVVVALIYGQSDSYSGWELILATIFFAFQIYFDFSAYSDIAIGTARLFGFSLIKNFDYPYFSKSIVQFWQKWHISLTSWFRDYIYIPLGGSRTNLPKYIRNILIVFLVSGFWHGANWTFIAWGLLHGLAFIPYAILSTRERYQKEKTADATLRDLPSILLTFLIVLVGWVFFRASSIRESFDILGSIATKTTASTFPGWQVLYPTWLIALAFIIVIEWLQRRRDHPLDFTGKSRPFRIGIYFSMILASLLIGGFNFAPFIYFQF